MMEKMEGCDQAAVESVVGPGVTVEMMEAQHSMMCSNSETCDIFGAAKCEEQQLQTPDSEPSMEHSCKYVHNILPNSPLLSSVGRL